jgi:hypothetical protein
MNISSSFKTVSGKNLLRFSASAEANAFVPSSFSAIWQRSLVEIANASSVPAAACACTLSYFCHKILGWLS